MRTANPGKPDKPDDDATSPEADEARRQRIQQQLDEALAATFPASDPVSIVTSQREESWDEP